MPSDAELLKAHHKLKRYDLVAQLYDLNTDSVRGRINRCIRLQNERLESTHVLTLLDKMLPAIPRYDAIPYLYGDGLVSADWHIPTTDWHMLELMVKFAERHLPAGKRKMALVGDLFNFDGLSKFDHVLQGYGLSTEFEYAQATLDYVFKVFDEIIFTLGNHDDRFLKKFEGALGSNHFGRMVSKHFDSGKLKVSVKSQGMVVSGGVDWRVTHQRNYSKIKGRVASDLSLKHQSNTITHHEHHVAILRDTYNRYTVVNNGMLGDYEKMAYVMKTDSTSGVMCSGFTFMRDGTAHLLTPYPTFTDWSLWDMHTEALPAIVAAEARMRRLSRPEPELFIVSSSKRKVKAA